MVVERLKGNVPFGLCALQSDMTNVALLDGYGIPCKCCY